MRARCGRCIFGTTIDHPATGLLAPGLLSQGLSVLTSARQRDVSGAFAYNADQVTLN